jgi:hypothetical protein
MPIKPENKALYPKDWDAISLAAKQRARWRCQHPGCVAEQYAVGRWVESGFCTYALGTTYAEAKQLAAEAQWRLFGDDPQADKLIVIVLTTAHLNHDPADVRPENLAPMCQRHHLAYDAEHHAETAYMTRMAKRGNLELPL